MSQIKFERVNSFFLSNLDLSIEVFDRNKDSSGPFSYSMTLPGR